MIGVLAVGVIGSGIGMGVHAKQKAPKASPTIHVVPLDEDFDANALKRPGIEVHPAPGNPDSGEWNLPERKTREEWLKDSGLSSEIMSWDEMDRDLLVVRAREHSLERLAELYPKLGKEKLAKLKGLAGEK